MKTFFPFIALFVVAFSFFRSYKESETTTPNQEEKKAQVSTKAQSSEDSSPQEVPAQALVQENDSSEITETKSEIVSLSVPEMNTDLTALDALDAFQKAIAEHKGTIENSDIIDTTVNNIRGYIAAEEER